jgi:cell wall-associated NlpC family hydrolase
MKLKISGLIFLTLVMSCSIQKPLTEQSKDELKLPFNKKNYPDTHQSFFVIVNAVGTNLNAVKSQALADAQFNLAQRALSIIESHLEIKLSNADEQSKSISKLNSISKSDVFANKIVLVENKSFIKENGKYDYWAVFSVSLEDVTKIINKKTDLDLDKDFYKSGIDKNFKLSVEENKIKSITENQTYGDSLSVENIDNKIIQESKKYIGIPYVWGGDDPESGFDCSGYVQWVLKESIDLYIPRTSIQQYNFLKSKAAKGLKQISAGDILFFKTMGSAVSHVGIALNNKTFIHAPNSDSFIREEKLDGYWKNKFFEGFKL